MDARQRKIYIKSMRRRWLVGKRLRQIVQYVLLLLFLYLFVSTARDGILQFPQLPIPENIFSLFNPLFALVSMIASRKIILTFIPAILLVIATIFLGRFWCGWICPLGSVLDLYGSIRRKNIPEGMRKVKYLLLAIIIVGALLGNLSLLFLDPITIFVRSLSGVFFPALANAIKPPAEGELGLVIQPVLITLFVLVLLLNIISKRFWCRYLCPLGALLGLISKISWLKRRVGEGCAKCGHCVPVCPMDAIDDELYSSDSGECIQCLNCEEKCPMAVTGLAYEWGIEASTINNPSRRQVLASATVGLAGAFALNTASVKASNPLLLRPPGAGDEDDFLTRCVRCGQCIQACPNGALQMSFLDAGIGAVWTPVLVPRNGYCEYSCNACGQVCPTEAIPPLTLEQKQSAVIGIAYVDMDRCIGCPKCRKACPVDAIEIVEQERDGKMVNFPQVIEALCIGCGACEYVCPIEGESAIRVARF